MPYVPHQRPGHLARSTRTLRAGLVVAAMLVGLVSCSSGGSAPGGGASADPSGTSSPSASAPTPESDSSALVEATTWCAALATKLGGGLEATASRPIAVRDLPGADARLAQRSLSALTPTTVLGQCAIGEPLSAATPQPTVAPQCPSGKATVAVFPPTRVWLVGRGGESVRLSSSTFGPQPLTQCT